MKVKKKVNLKKKECLYEFQIDDMTVEMAYSDNNKKFSQCIINILKERLN